MPAAPDNVEIAYGLPKCKKNGGKDSEFSGRKKSSNAILEIWRANWQDVHERFSLQPTQRFVANMSLEIEIQVSINVSSDARSFIDNEFRCSIKVWCPNIWVAVRILCGFSVSATFFKSHIALPAVDRIQLVFIICFLTPNMSLLMLCEVMSCRKCQNDISGTWWMNFISPKM